ncbi:fumarylacetoacetate hydrolase family protein [Spongorhabdus nitratireducens]
MTYKHTWVSGDGIDLPVGKVVCVGRNYAEHAKELNNPIPSEPLLFIKPSTAVTRFERPIKLSSERGEVHYETEISVLIGQKLSDASEQDAVASITGIGLGLDLTLRDVQSQLKEKGHPWEKAKAFDNSCPLTGFVATKHLPSLDDINLKLYINGLLRQQGNSSQMLTAIPALISQISQHFTLLPGDIVLTGTPAGVGALSTGDELRAELDKLCRFHTRVTD